MALIVERLEDIYPEAVCALEYGGEPWRLVVMARLSAQWTRGSFSLWADSPRSAPTRE